MLWSCQYGILDRRKICAPLFQFIHRAEIRISRGAEGKEGKAFVGSMTDEKALEMASKVVSEGFVFAVSIGYLDNSWYRFLTLCFCICIL